MDYCKLVSVLITALLVSTSAVGDYSDPQVLAKEYFAAMQNERMTVVGRFMPPNALSEFNSMLIPVFRAEADSGQRQLMDATFGKFTNFEDLQEMEPVKLVNGFMNLVIAQTGGEAVGVCS